MKFNYDYDDGKILALDDKVGVKEYEYQDNIDSIIALENVIEILEKDRKKLENNRDKKNVFQERFFWSTFGFCFLMLFMFIYIGQGFLCVETTINYILGYGNHVLGVILSTIVGRFGYLKYKDYAKEIKVLEKDIDDIFKIIDDLTIKLEQYKSIKTNTREREFINKKSPKLSFIQQMNSELKRARAQLENMKQNRNQNDEELKTNQEKLLKKVNDNQEN